MNLINKDSNKEFGVFIGFETKEVHGETVQVKMFDEVYSPTIDWEDKIQRASGVSDLSGINAEILHFFQKLERWKTLDDSEIEFYNHIKGKVN